MNNRWDEYLTCNNKKPFLFYNEENEIRPKTSHGRKEKKNQQNKNIIEIYKRYEDIEQKCYSSTLYLIQ